MAQSSWLLPAERLLPVAGLALACLVVSLSGLALAHCIDRRRYALRHAVLLASLLAITALPLLAVGSQWCELGWQVRLPSTGDNATTPQAMVKQHAAGDVDFEDVVQSEEPLYVAGVPVNPAARDADALAPQRTDVIDSSGATFPQWTPQHAATVADSRLDLAGRSSRLIGTFAAAIWVVGGLFSLVHLTKSRRELAAHVRRFAICSNPELLNLLQECATRIGLRSTPRLKVGSGPVPFVCGLRRPEIVVPLQCLENFESSTLRAMLLHELAHIRRRDPVVGLAQRLVQSIYWWNPLLRRLNAEIDDLREDLCDDYVLTQGTDREQYAEALVALASEAVSHHIAPALGLLSRPRRRLTARIQRILNEDRTMSTRLGGVSKVLLVLFVFALGVGATLLSFRVSEVIDSTDDVRVSLVSADDPYPVDVASHVEGDVSDAAVAQVEPNSVAPAEPEFDDLPTAPEEGEWQEADTFAEALPNPVPAANLDAGPADFTSATPPEFDPGLETAEDVFNEPFAQDAGSLDFGSGPGGSPFAPSSDGQPDPPPVPTHSLILIELTASEDGNLGGIRYLTEDLGADEDAFNKLVERIAGLAKQLDTEQNGRRIEVRLSADSDLRYEHVARVVTGCSQFVDRVVFASQPPTIDEVVTLSIGFVRDGQGRKITSTPVLIWQDELVQPGELASQLAEWHLPQSAKAQSVTMTLRADPDVSAEFVRSVIQSAQQAGFEEFTLKTLLPHPPAIEGVINEITTDNDGHKYLVSIGSDDGLAVGHELTVTLPPAATADGTTGSGAISGTPSDDAASLVLGRLIVVTVAPDSAICVHVGPGLVNDSFDRGIQKGDIVRTTPPAKPTGTVSPAADTPPGEPASTFRFN